MHFIILPFFQPILNIKTNKIEKFECLIRLIDEDGKAVEPFFFLDIAKKVKIYNKLTMVVIEKAFKVFKENSYEFSINLSIEDILNEELELFLLEKIEQYRVGSRLILEIVETEEIENFKPIQVFCQKLRTFGCKIAIDDFGTGYSNFEYLAKLDVDIIKIDGSLIKNIQSDNGAHLIANTIHTFSKNIKAKTVAEYVENREILTILKEMGVDYAQGYHIGRPAEELKNDFSI